MFCLYYFINLSKHKLKKIGKICERLWAIHHSRANSNKELHFILLSLCKQTTGWHYYFNLFLNKSNPIRCCKFQPFPFFVTHFIISNAYVLSLKIPSKKWKLFISDYNCSFSIRDIRWSSGWKTSHTTFFLIIKKSNLRKMVWIEAVEMYNSRGLKPLPRKYPF